MPDFFAGALQLEFKRVSSQHIISLSEDGADVVAVVRHFVALNHVSSVSSVVE